MRKILAIAWKDLRSIARNRSALVMMLVAPLGLAALLGFAFGGGSGGFDIAATKVAVANLDEGAAVGGSSANEGALVADILGSPELADVLDVSQEDGAEAARSAVDDGEVAVAVIVPREFSATVYSSDPTATTKVELYENPTREIGGAIVESVVGQALLGFNGARAAAAGAVALRADGDPPPAELAAQAAGAFARSGGVSDALDVTQRSPAVPGQEDTKSVAVTGLILAGMMVFFMFFGAANAARTILDEDQAGTLPRLFTTPTSHGIVLGGKFVSVFVTVALQAVVLLVAGGLIFSIDWGPLDAVVLLTLVAAGVASGLALLVIALVRTPAQAGAIGAGVYLVLALAGGNFTGTAQTGTTYAVIQRFTPNGWLLHGWDTTMRGGGLGDIRWQLLVPLGFAAAFFVVAVLRIRRRFA
jgi:ABC-2 type transport system permease protein